MRKILLFILFAHLIAFIALQFYMPSPVVLDAYDNVKAGVSKIVMKYEEYAEVDRENIDTYTITLSQFANNYDPSSYDFLAKRELSFIYEPLVDFDQYMDIKSGLAVSWGMLNDKEWIFILREDVKFHDQSDFNADDVIASYNRAKNHPNSTLKTVTDKIESIEKLDDYKIKIKTTKAFPTFLAQMTNLFIVPSELEKNFKLDTYIGTGKYYLLEREKNRILLKKNFAYSTNIKKLPAKIELNLKENKYARIDMLLNGESQFLADVPPLFMKQIEDNEETDVLKSPGVKSVFLIFNFSDRFLSSSNHRKALNIAIDREKMKEIAGESSTISTQFVGSGVFGFNPEISLMDQSKETAKGLIQKTAVLTIVLTPENQLLGEFIKSEFKEIGVRTTFNIVNNVDLINRLQAGKGDLFLIGWDFSEGSVDTLFEELIHSNGKLNGFSYYNKNVNDIISKSLYEMDEKKRLKNFQEIMKIITVDDLIGVPLFTVDNLFALRTSVSDQKICIRPDGIIRLN